MSENRFVEHIQTLIANPSLCIPGISDMFHGWLSTRRWLSIVLPVPILAVLLGSIFFALYVRSQHREVLATPFAKKIEKELPTAALFKQLVDRQLPNSGVKPSTVDLVEPHQLDRMKLLIAHALRLDAKNQSLEFRAAILQVMIDSKTNSEKIMNDLAPEDSIRFSPAHAWKALQILSSEDSSRMDLERLEHHLKGAAIWKGVDQRIFERASLVCEAEKQIGMSMDFARIAADLNPDNNLRLAELAGKLGRKSERKEALETAIRNFSAKIGTDLDQTAARIGLATAQRWLDRPNDAIATLRSGMQLTNCDPKQIRPKLVEVLLDLHRKGVKESRDITMFDPVHLNEAATILPTDANLNEETAELMLIKTLDEKSPAVVALKKAIADRSATARTHAALGQIYFNKGQFSSAIKQSQLAVSKNPNEFEAMLCLAKSCLRVAPPNTELASEMIERALQLRANDARLPSIQGDVKHANGDLVGAVKSWEIALKKEENSNELHRRLYETYRKLGKRDEAEIHRLHLLELGDPPEGLTNRK